MGKAGGVLVCLFVALVFGGVGAFASWAIGSTLLQAHRAQDWVRVRATVESAALRTGGSGSTTYQAQGTYRYAFGGREYAGSRLGVSAVGGSDNIDDWHQEVSARLEDARAAGRPIMVWVDPDDPAQSVLDREIRWSEIIFFVPFALAFGGVGVGALVAMAFVLRGKAGGGGANGAMANAVGGQGAPAGAQAPAGAGFLWLFAFFWNAISFPIAILVVRDVAESGEWAGLFVLLFPLVGLGLAWSAVSLSIAALRARFGGRTPEPRPPSSRPTAPGRFAAQAARAMFDPQDAASQRAGARLPGPREPEIPPSVAEVEERGGALTLRYSMRRNLGLAVVLFVTGGVLAAVGAAFFAGEGIGFAAVALIVLGALVDLAAASTLASRLQVSVRGAELSVERVGLFGRKSWKARRESIARLRPVVTHTINGQPYFAINAELASGEKIPVGNGIKGTDLADAVARRVAKSLGIDYGSVAGAEPAAAEFSRA